MSLGAISPDTVGGAVALVLALALTALLVKVITLLRRPTTHKLSVVALVVILAGILLTGLLAMGMSHAGSRVQLLAILTGLVMLGSIAGTFITAIIGLSTYDSMRFKQGRTQAVSALVISSLLVLLLVASWMQDATLGRARTRIPTPSGNGISWLEPVTETRAEKENCAMTREKGWIVCDHASLNPISCMLFRSARPEAYAMIIGEPVSGISVETYASLVKDNLKLVCSSIENEQLTPDEVDGMKFLRRTCVARLKDQPALRIHYEHCMTIQGSGAYQIVFWCPVQTQKTVQPAFDRMLASFRILDPSRKIGGESFANLQRPDWGYETKIDASQWQACDELNPELADSGGDRTLEAFRVIPVTLTGGTVSDDILADGLLPRIGIGPNDRKSWTSEPWQSGWGKGLEFTGSKRVDNTDFNYLLRVVRRDRIALLIAGWSAKENGDSKLVRATLDRITALPSPPKPPEPNPKRLREMSFVHNDIGLGFFSQDRFSDAAQWFITAHGFSPQDAAILGNAANALQQAGETDRGLELLQSNRKLMEKSPDLLQFHALLLADKGEIGDANMEFIKAIGLGFDGASDVVAWLRKMNDGGHFAESEALAKAWVARKPGIDSRIWMAQTVAASGDSERALGLFEAVTRDFPNNSRALTEYAGALNDAGSFDRAGEIASDLLKKGKPTAQLHMILGWSQMGRKWFREAKATFEKAAKLAPDDPEVLAAVRRASAQLGQGMDIDTKSPIKPVPMPDAVAEVLAGFQPDADYAKERPQAYLLSSLGYSAEKGKPLRRTWRYRIRVNSPEGVNNLSSVDRTFDPLGERIYLNELAVTGPDGKKTDVSATDAYVRDDEDGGASHRKAFHFQIPGLKPGCVIDYTLTIEDLKASGEFAFERHLFAESAAKAVFVTGDVSAIKAVVTNQGSIKTIRGKSLAAWIGLDLPMVANEPMGLPYEDTLGFLTLGPAGTTWQQVGADYLKDIADRLKPEPEITALARKLVAGAKSERERAAILARHVQQSIGYTAIEFGVRARVPNAATLTIKNQYGDCKDQALLVHQLLTAAGVESHLALVNTSWRVRPEQPTLDQFDHVVVHVPALGPGRLLDSTDRHLDLTEWQSDALWHSHALVLQPDNVRLMEPKAFAEPARPSLDIRRRIQPEGDGWDVRETIEFKGYCASWIRRAFGGLDADGRLKRAQGIMGNSNGIRVSAFTFDNLDDPAKPARIEITYQAAGTLRAEGSRMRAKLPAVWESDYLATEFVKQRTSPFVVRHPLSIRTELRISGIPAPAAESLADLAQQGGKRFAKWTMTVRPDGKDTVIGFDFTSESGNFKAGDYAAWHEEWQSASAAWDRPLIWAKP